MNNITQLLYTERIMKQIISSLNTKRKGKFLVLMFMGMMFALTSSAQTKTVTGTVTDSDDQPIPGVNIIESGTNNGTISDLNGTYAITVNEGATLNFSFVGMLTEKVDVSGQTQINVTLVPDLIGLDEVQVVAYGTTTRREITGSIGHIENEAVERNVGTNVAAALQGRTAGVQITNVPGDRDVRIRIRGASSFLASSEPLIVVDGVPSGLGLSDINPTDIESMDVLKDAAASVLYGSRAANGVILITTKSGEAGKTKIDVTYQHGIVTPGGNKPDMLNGSQYLQVLDKAHFNYYGQENTRPSIRYENQGGFYPYEYEDPITGEVIPATNFNTDWLDMMYKNGSYDRISLAASGGTESTSFYISGQYRADNGYMRQPDYNKVNGRIKLDHKINKMITVGANVAFAYDKRLPFSEGGGFSAAQGSALPVYPLYDPNDPNSYWYNFTSYDVNFIAKSQYKSNHNRNTDILNVAYINIEPIKNLNLRSEWSYKYHTFFNENYSHPVILPPGFGESTGDGRVTVGRGENRAWNTNNTATYSKLFGTSHSLKVMAGFTMDSRSGGNTTAFQEGFPNSSYVHSNGLTNKNERVSSGYGETRFSSIMSRLNYGFRERYFLELSYRQDYSSRFGPDKRRGVFPSASASWMFSEEPFMDNLDFLYMGRFRGSYGKTGNAEIGNFRYLGATLPWFTYGQNTGVIFERIGNSALQWENTYQTNLGLDMAFAGGRVEINLDYWDKLSEDMLLQYRIGMFHGYWSSNIETNLGSLKWTGYEAALNTVNIQGLGGGFKWETNMNITFAQSEVVKLARSYFEAGTNRAVEGQPLGAYYLPQWAGVDPVTGHELIYEVNPVAYAENLDAVTTEHLTGNVLDAETMAAGKRNQMRVLDPSKSPYPDWYGGVTNTFSYKGIGLSFLFWFQLGNWIYDEAEQNRSYISTSTNASTKLLNGWSKENPSNVPLLLNSSGGGTSSRFLYNGSYGRLRNVQLSYDVPGTVLQKLKIEQTRIYVSGQNLLLFTKFPGVDPEFKYDYDDNLNPGLLKYQLPQARTFLLGVDFSF